MYHKISQVPQTIEAKQHYQKVISGNVCKGFTRPDGNEIMPVWRGFRLTMFLHFFMTVVYINFAQI